MGGREREETEWKRGEGEEMVFSIRYGRRQERSPKGQENEWKYIAP